MALLEVRDLQVRYGRVSAVRGVSLAVEQGSILAVLGRNGAGKSSLLGAIAGKLRGNQGQVLWRGQDVSRLSADQRARLGISLVPEGRQIFPNLTIWENLRLGGFYLHGTTFTRSLENVYQIFPILQERARSPAGRLSGGQQQMLAIGRALISGPALMLLDEPSLGLAPLIVDELYTQLAKLKETGITMVLVEQHAQRALQAADQALVLNLGAVALEGHPEAIANDPRLVRAYMGGF